MKIIFFANTDWYLFNFRLGLAKCLRDKGAEVVFMSPPGAYGGRIEAAGFRWISLQMDRQSLNVASELKLVLQIAKIYRHERPDVVHNFTIKCVVYGSLAAQLAGVDGRINAVAGLGHVFTSGTLQARILKPLVKLLLRLALRGASSHLILQNPDDLALFNRLHMIDEKQIHLIKGSGVNTTLFTPVKHERGKRFRVLLASRLLWEKGIRQYVEAARLLRGRIDEVEFLLAGSADPGNPSAVREQDIAGWTKEGLVTMLGHLENMDTVMGTVDLVVLPSYYGEGVPRGLIEAAAMGLPIITTNAPGCREIVEDGINGFLIPIKDGQALASKIERLLDDPAMCQRYGVAGRQKALDEFGEGIVFPKTWDVYQQASPGLLVLAPLKNHAVELETGEIS